MKVSILMRLYICYTKQVYTHLQILTLRYTIVHKIMYVGKLITIKTV